MRTFITFGDEKFATAKKRIFKQALDTNQFDNIICYSPDDITEEVKTSILYKENRGFGYWIWKPDLIQKSLNYINNGDILVYCDAGCSLYKGKEWNKYWKILEKYDLIASRIYQRNENWSRIELMDKFSVNGKYWGKLYQFMATVIILKKTPESLNFINQWRSLMLNYPNYVRDVTLDEKYKQKRYFIESRHDQSIYSALLYYHLKNTSFGKRVYTQWEHYEDKDIFNQVIRATRQKNMQERSSFNLIK